MSNKEVKMGDCRTCKWREGPMHELQEIAYAKRLNRKKLIALTERMEGDL